MTSGDSARIASPFAGDEMGQLLVIRGSNAVVGLRGAFARPEDEHATVGSFLGIAARNSLVIGVVGLILLTASTMAGLAAADVSRYLVLVLRPLLPLVELVFIVLFFIAGLIVRAVIAVLSRISRRDVVTPGQPPAFFDDLLRRLREIEMNPQVVEGARWGMALGLLALLIIGMAVTIVVLRRREPNAFRPFKALGYPLAPAIFTISCFIILANALYTDLVRPLTQGTDVGPSAWGLLVIGMGLPIYYLFSRRRT